MGEYHFTPIIYIYINRSGFADGRPSIKCVDYPSAKLAEVLEESRWVDVHWHRLHHFEEGKEWGASIACWDILCHTGMPTHAHALIILLN